MINNTFIHSVNVVYISSNHKKNNVYNKFINFYTNYLKYCSKDNLLFING